MTNAGSARKRRNVRFFQRYFLNPPAKLAVRFGLRVCIKGKWRTAQAQVVPDDDAQARLGGFGRSTHAAILRRFGTDLTTVRLDF